MANHMSEIAKMLGVELGERFTIKDLDGEIMGTAIIDECGFKLIEYNVNYTNSWHQYALENLLTGNIRSSANLGSPNTSKLIGMLMKTGMFGKKMG